MQISVNQNGWAITNLESIATRITKGGTPTTYGFSFQNSGINFLKVENIEFGRVNLKSITDFIGQDAHDFQSKSKLDINDILFSIAGTIGETCLIKAEYLPANTNQALAIIKGTECIIAPKLLQLQLEAFVAKVKIKARGGAMNNVSLEDLKNLSVYIPPFNEQYRIVDKIEEFFSSLDKGIESLKLAQQQLKVYRQAVLKWAFEGKFSHTNIKDGELPENWRWVKIEDIASVGTGATPLKSNKEYYQNGTIPWVTSGALNDSFVRKATNFVTEKALNETNLSIYPKNTLLLAMYGEGKTRGKCSELLIEASTNQAIAAIYFDKHDIEVKTYLKYFLLKNYNDIRKMASGGVQPNINLGIVKKTLIPLPPTIQEQQTIVQEIEFRLSVCDKIEETIKQSLLQAESLRQSILKKAFEGKLVPQDPNDEPASILLERIKAEREMNKPEPKTKAKSKKKADISTKPDEQLSLNLVLSDSKIRR